MSPKTSAVVSAFALIVIGYLIFFATERPSPTLAIFQYILLALALIGLIGSVVKIARAGPSRE